MSLSKPTPSKQKEDATVLQAPKVLKFRYQCHGCTNDLGLFEDNVAGKTVTCGRCGKAQQTKIENYIAL